MNARKEKRVFLGMAVLMVGIFFTVAYAIPPAPQNIYGTARDAGGNALPGATLTVKLNNSATAAQMTDNSTSITGTSAATTGAGYYDINLIMDDPETGTMEGATAGDVVHIFINGAEASETKSGTIVVVSGGFRELNIGLPDTAGPVTSDLKADGSAPLDMPQGTTAMTLTAAVSDTGTGSKAIKAAEYFIGTAGTAGTGTPMSASDGNFDSATEDITALVNTSTLTATGSPYTISVRGQDVGNNWGAVQTVQITIYQAPTAPALTNVTTPTGNTQPIMTWSAVAGATKYDFQLATDAGFVNVLAPHTQTGIAATSYTPAVALADGTYYWRVRAIDAADHAGPWASSAAFVVDTTAPTAATGMDAVLLTNGSIQINWMNPAADFAGIVVVAATDLAPTLTPVNGTVYTAGINGVVAVGNINTFTDGPLTHGTRRYYKLFVYDALYNYSAATSVDATGSDTAAPAPPTGFTATPGDTKVTVSWTNPADTDFVGVIVLYKQGSAPTSAPTQWASHNVGDTIGDATVGYKGNLQTAQISGLTNNVPCYITIYAYDERPNYSSGASTNAVPVPFGITAPAAATVDVKIGQQVALSASGPSGSFQWMATGGTLAAATGANVTWTAPATVTASPTAYTITLKDGTNPALTDTRTIKVYSSVIVGNKPTTTLTVHPGTSSAAFTVSGGDSTSYTWTVTDRNGTAIGTPQTGTSVTFTAPDTGSFAGDYTITVTDNLGFSTDSFKVRVPIILTPSSGTFLQTDPQSFIIAGGGSTYAWVILNESTLAVVTNPAAEYGAWTKASPVSGDATNTFIPAAITTAKGFYIQVAVDGASDLTGIFGPFRIIPVLQYTVSVKTSSGAAIADAQVTVDYTGQTPQTTNAEGKAYFTLPATSGKYLYEISKAGYVTQIVSDEKNPVTVTLKTVGSQITGTVAPLPVTAGAAVTAYLPTAPATRYETTTTSDGTYAIGLPTGSATTGWTVVAAKAGYTSAQQTGKASNATGVDFTLTAITGTAPDVDVGGGSKSFTGAQTIHVEVPAGGVTTNGYILISESAEPTQAPNLTSGSPGHAYEIKVSQDESGTTPLSAADIKMVIITIPVDLRLVKPGDLEKNVFTIYKAADRAALEAGNVKAVPAANIIATDYIGNGTVGSVTFWVDSLSIFVIGAGTGLSSSGIPGEGCFIATAAYGSYFEKHVQILRDFRDVYLMPSKIGRSFVAFYYRHSPPLAAFIAKCDTLRAVARVGLAPVIGLGYVALHTTPVEKFMILMLLIGTLTGSFIWMWRIRRIHA